MSYQVLARKWRPRSFREMVGQEHVLKALINALDHQRLHHAYLFAGTRGVGKTTIARILAKCLNCETGISSEPCGECSACLEISEGRFVDLIEVDAASRTRVEDTRDLLDNVQYAPSRGRFKIYLIDEVHMLSNHSFNALLKTLEEPPEHVKFLLATTDPQKLPVTILSRCLQFNLQNMSPERITQHLQRVLAEEMVPFDESALWLLARAADGSMRDALSLTDQAIGFGSGKIADADVSAMLGTIDHRLIERLVAALANIDGAAMLTAVAQFAEQSPDYHTALGDLITLLHRVAIAQALPEALDNSYGDREQILQFARQLTPEDVQLFYQTALIGRRDLSLAPDARGGFEMVLLRMLAFRPQGVVDVPSAPLPAAEGSLPTPPQAAAGPQIPIDAQAAADPQAGTDQHSGGSARQVAAKVDEEAPSVPASRSPEPPVPSNDAPPPEEGAQDRVKKSISKLGPEALVADLKSAAQLKRPEPAPEPEAPKEDVATVAPVASAPGQLEEFSPGHWLTIYDSLQIRGVLQSTAANCVLLGREGNQLYFALDHDKGSLFDESHRQRLTDLLSDYFAQPVKVHIELQALPEGQESPAQHRARLRREAKEDAVAQLKVDPIVQQLEHEMGAVMDVESVQVH